MEILALLKKYISSPEWLAFTVICIMWLPTLLPVPTEKSNNVYTIIYKIINFISANVGKAKNAQELPKTAHKTNCLLVALAITLAITTGCALKTLEPHEKALAITQELTETYYIIEDQFHNLPDDLKPKVGPMVNEYKHLLVLLRDAASNWYITKTKPLDFDTLAERISILIKDIYALIE